MLFYRYINENITTCIMVLKKAKKDNCTLFIDATKECIKITNSNKLTDENIQHILDLFTERNDVQYVSRLVSNDGIVI